VLSGRAASLQGLWGAALLPPSEIGIMTAIKAAGLIKVASAGAFLPAFGWLAFLGVFAWAGGMDIGRWREHAPRSMGRQAKVLVFKSVVWCLA
jgi:hypothetical protein